MMQNPDGQEPGEAKTKQAGFPSEINHHGHSTPATRTRMTMHRNPA